MPGPPANLLSKTASPCPPNAPTYVYDGENRMTNFMSGSATYTYDGNGLRVQKAVSGGAATVYIYSGSRDIAEYDNGAAPSAPSREFIWAGVLPGPGLVASITAGTPPTINYFHSDHLSVRVVTNSSGTDIGEQGHYPFGESWYAHNSANGEFVFTTYQRDGESGLDYALARYYDSGSARFCSADPVGGQPGDPQSWNRYAYVENDPINLTDPSGMGFLDWLLKGFGALLAVIGVVTFNPGLTAVGLQIAGAGLWAGLGGYQAPSGPYPGSTPTTLPSDSLYSFSPAQMRYATTAPFIDPSTAPSLSAATVNFVECAGPALIIKGNPRFIGHVGAIPPYKITANSAAVAPEQFGPYVTGDDIRGFSNQVSGYVQYLSGSGAGATVKTFNFSTITDVIDDVSNPGNFRIDMLNDNPGLFLIELPGLPEKSYQQEGNVVLRVPANVGCPGGTRPE